MSWWSTGEVDMLAISIQTAIYILGICWLCLLTLVFVVRNDDEAPSNRPARRDAGRSQSVTTQVGDEKGEKRAESGRPGGAQPTR
jgi:hypothetical protein